MDPLPNSVPIPPSAPQMVFQRCYPVYGKLNLQHGERLQVSSVCGNQITNYLAFNRLRLLNKRAQMEYEGKNEERAIFNDAINAIYYRL